ncbi:acetylserotonin O-methyltransferase [Geomonas sp. RF6]|uniref:acetylserotonin O-methyltransferase n=1 Tax=Geomonas sp. RF6 TaxID=2897342 RepID=UPI001E4A7384|nr:acetylserotonin O-methyltransferase [Geomonas sp. RF6]UFS70295.1 acetylserotonin O-methyltransferase [Geomonas sp. RF6]
MNDWNVPKLLELSGSYWNVCTVQAGVKLNVFTPLAEGALSADELATRLSCDPRGMETLLNALSALGLLEKRNARYGATPFAARFLSRTSPEYLGHIIMHHHHLLPSWTRLDQAVATGVPVRESVAYEDDASVRESFLMGMFNLAMQLAPRVAEGLDLKGRKRLLDLGGGPGTYAIHFCLQNPEMFAVICDLPSTRKFAEETVGRFNLSDRISFEARDFDTEEIPGGFDAAWLSHILHGEGPRGCATILRKAAAALNPGGLLMVQEFILDDTKDRPLFPALFSLNMLVGTTEGRSYSQGEISAMLEEAGARDIRRIPLELPNGAGAIAGTIPG